MHRRPSMQGNDEAELHHVVFQSRSEEIENQRRKVRGCVVKFRSKTLNSRSS